MHIIHGNPFTIWVPVKPATTIYVDSLVCIDSSALDEGVIVRGQADGAADTTNKDVPLGIVVGTNNYNPQYSATYQAEYITAAAAAGPHTSTTDYRGVEGPYSKGDKRAMVEVAVIDPCTVIRAPIFNNAVGTPPTELTVSTGSATGLGCTTDACDFTPVANNSTIYFRTGNRGIYRQTDDTSTTVATWDVATPYDVAVGDKAVRVPVPQLGQGFVRMGDDTCCSYINCSETPATDHDVIEVIRLDLSRAGHEFCDFRFGVDHFALLRA